jgi:hypothetical protein
LLYAIPLVSVVANIIVCESAVVVAERVYQPVVQVEQFLSTKNPVIGEFPKSATMVEKEFHPTTIYNLVEL